MIVLYLKVLNLIDVLTVFVSECRKQIDCVSILNSELDCWNSDSFWISSYHISIHLFITCWKQNKNLINMKKFSSELVYCNLKWQDKLNNWRWNYVFVQKYEKSSNNYQQNLSVIKNKMMRQLQLIVIVVNSERKNESNNCLKYINAFIEFFWFENLSMINHHYNMMKMKTWHTSNARNSCNINIW